MHRRYYFLMALFILLTAGLLFLPNSYSAKERDPMDLAQAINNQSRYISTDQVAARIIEKDPTLVLIDVRDTAQYRKFSLEGAYNIPLPSLLNEENQQWLTQSGTEVVFYSNGDIDAEKAWLTLFRKGYNNLYIMKGGLNAWAETILKPQAPAQTDAKDLWDQYQFRQAAGLYFRGGEVILEETPIEKKPQAAAPKVVKVAPKPQAVESEGGC